jgi:hypothetical protein
LIREEEREKKMKIRLEKQRLEKENETKQKDLREMEWGKGSERARRTKEEAKAEEDATKRICYFKLSGLMPPI